LFLRNIIVHLASLSPLRSVIFHIKKKRTKEKNSPNDASARSEKNKKISKSSPDFIGKGKPPARGRAGFYDFLLFFSFTANDDPPFGQANALFFSKK